MALPPLPDSLKPIKLLLKCAEQHDKRDLVVAYYCRLCAFQKGHGLDATSTEAKTFLVTLISQLEKTKTENHSNENIASEMLGLAYVESYALKLFSFAYQNDLNSDFSLTTIQTFLTAGVLLEVVTTLGQPVEELEKAKNYARWKSVYLSRCKQTGEVPQPGPVVGEEGAEAPSFVLNQQPTAQSGSTQLVSPKQPSPPTQPVKAVQPPQPKPPASSLQPGTSLDKAGEDNDFIDPKTYQAIEKHLKYAHSALQHHDKVTVRSYLEQAIKELK